MICLNKIASRIAENLRLDYKQTLYFAFCNLDLSHSILLKYYINLKFNFVWRRGALRHPDFPLQDLLRLPSRRCSQA